MVTERLYYQDAYRCAFQARVVARDTLSGRPAVALDRTVFYPESGGQPADIGTLNGIEVVALQDDGTRIWHLLADELPVDRVEGLLDWPQRRDHMQSHSGQHILSQAFVETAGAQTVGWHLSANSLTIDLDHNGLDDADLDRAEQRANEVVQENRPITARLVPERGLAALALRKTPDVQGPLRIVEIADFDRVACSGTHVSSTAQVGLVKIGRAERRGAETRIHFLCGGRAVADYSRKHDLVRALARRFTRAEEELLEAVAKLEDDVQAARRRLKMLENEMVAAEAARLLAVVGDGNRPRFIRQVYPHWEPDQVKRLASALRTHPQVFVALAGGEPPRVFYARSDDLEVDAGQILRETINAVGGRGGGRADFAQGSVPTASAAEVALNAVAELLAVA